MRLFNASKKPFKNKFGFYEKGKGVYMKAYFSEGSDYEFLKAYENRFRGAICVE